MVHKPNASMKRAKHIDVKYHLIRDCVMNGTVSVQHVRSEDNLADEFTKPLGRVAFQKFRDKIDVLPIDQNPKPVGGVSI